MKRVLIVTICLLSSFNVFSNEKKDETPLEITTYSIPIGNQRIHETSISSTDLYNVFTLMFRYWDDGTKIRIILLNETLATHKEFLWEFLGLSPTRYRELIETNLSSGRNDRPVIVSDEEQMIKKVSTIEGSIGYIGNGYFVVLGKEKDVKIIKVSND